jgi:hypothetical protein
MAAPSALKNDRLDHIGFGQQALKLKYKFSAKSSE